MTKYIKQTGILAIISASEKMSENQIISKAEKHESNAADSLALSRTLRKQSGLLTKREGKALKRQAKLLERQAVNDTKQAELYRKHLKLSRKFNH